MSDAKSPMDQMAELIRGVRYEAGKMKTSALIELLSPHNGSIARVAYDFAKDRMTIRPSDVIAAILQCVADEIDRRIPVPEK